MKLHKKNLKAEKDLKVKRKRRKKENVEKQNNQMIKTRLLTIWKMKVIKKEKAKQKLNLKGNH